MKYFLYVLGLFLLILTLYSCVSIVSANEHEFMEFSDFKVTDKGDIGNEIILLNSNKSTMRLIKALNPKLKDTKLRGLKSNIDGGLVEDDDYLILGPTQEIVITKNEVVISRESSSKLRIKGLIKRLFGCSKCLKKVKGFNNKYLYKDKFSIEVYEDANNKGRVCYSITLINKNNKFNKED